MEHPNQTEPSEANTPIQQIGDYLNISEDGYIINELSKDTIQDAWKPVIEDTVAEYKNHFGEGLIAVYIRGSVAKGRAIDDISDLDNIAIVDLPEDTIDLEWKDEFLQQIHEKYPFVDDVEIVVMTVNEFQKDHNSRMLLKTQGLNVYGADITQEIPEFQLGVDMVAHAFGLENSIKSMQKTIKKESDPEVMRSRCKVVMKRIVRVGFEIVMVRDRSYTRDLYLCWKTFSKYYPEKSEEMYQALKLAVDPTSNTREISIVLDGIGEWLVEEVKNVFPEGRN